MGKWGRKGRRETYRQDCQIVSMNFLAMYSICRTGSSVGAASIVGATRTPICHEEGQTNDYPAKY